MVEREALVQEPLEVAPDPVAVAARDDEHVRGQGGKARGDRPDVQVVHLDDALGPRQREPHLLRVDPGGRLLEQDPHRVAEDPPRAGEHERADRERGEWVGVLPAGDHDDQARHDHAGRSEQVGEDVEERGLHVQVLRSRAREDPRRGNVDHRAGDADHEHPAARDLGRVVEPPERGDDDPDRDGDERGAVDERGEDLGAAGAEAPPRRRRPGRQPGRQEREAEGGGVREHVRSVGEHGERVGDQTDRHLDDREARDEQEGGAESPPVSARRRAQAVGVAGLRVHEGQVKCCRDENHFGRRSV